MIANNLNNEISDIINELIDILLDMQEAVSLNQKTTLEDKEIVAIFYSMSCQISQLLTICFNAILKNESLLISNDLKLINNIINSIKPELDKYRKTINFNYQFYEQYFAYNFLINIKYQFTWLNDLRDIVRRYNVDIDLTDC